MAPLIILFALWTYPIICYLILRLSRKKFKVRKQIFIASAITVVLTIMGLFTNISTTLPELNWILLTSPYFNLCLALWWTQFQSKKLMKFIGIVLMFIVFGLGYFSATAGILGVGFIVGRYEEDKEVWLGDGLIYKEFRLGNAISDYRGKEVEICRTIKWLPIIEWRVITKSYYEIITYVTPLNVEYKKDEMKVYLSANMK
jgi:hypothetical protein